MHVNCSLLHANQMANGTLTDPLLLSDFKLIEEAMQKKYGSDVKIRF